MKKKNYKGLDQASIETLREQYGYNELTVKEEVSNIKKVIDIFMEPMFLMLFVTAAIYFILGEPVDGSIMLLFVITVLGIETFQKWKTNNALVSLKNLAEPQIVVVREGGECEIPSRELLPGDVMIVHEGVKIPADGVIIELNDLLVNESMLTGESEPVWKVEKESEKTSDIWRKDYCYSGTEVMQGYAKVYVEAIGNETIYGGIGQNISKIQEEKTPFQDQISKLVIFCTKLALTFFALVTIFSFINSDAATFLERVTYSILTGITLAMAMIPEEFPVILTVFLSMGAWRLAKNQALVRELSAVEALGSVSTLCVDKTGTITKNKMEVASVWNATKDVNFPQLLALACEVEPYDPMEQAIHAYCLEQGLDLQETFSHRFISEYPFTNEAKMMGHVWSVDEQQYITVKGAPESVLAICELEENEKKEILQRAEQLQQKGQRVLAVAFQHEVKDAVIPELLEECHLTFAGLIGLIDPPRENIYQSIQEANEAGIRIAMITGDNGTTATAIATQVGIDTSKYEPILGAEIEQLSDEELANIVGDVTVFSRVVPEHKMRIVQVLKANNEVVAMTGDGVNDAPALKYADIGIAMGNSGSDVAKEVSDIILMDDDFSTIISTIKDGRRIYDNICKAVSYVFTIHIPIAFIALFTSILGIGYENALLLPLHIVLLELIIDPTCSIVLESQPAEEDIMKRKPRNRDEKIVTKAMLIKSIMQGVVLFLASFGTYLVVSKMGTIDIDIARTMSFVVLVVGNIFLVFVNSSNINSFFYTVKHAQQNKTLWIATLLISLILLILIHTPLNTLVDFKPLTFMQLIQVVSTGALSVLWYEVVKWWKRRK